MDVWITRFGRSLRGAALALAWAALWPIQANAQEYDASADVVLAALSHLGVPYRYGGDEPARGFDCSGLVRHVFLQSAALELPRNSADMARLGHRVGRDDLQPGDLVFFNTRGQPNSHVGIYIGDGRFVHAPARRGHVRVEPFDATYWRARFNGARRLPGVVPVARVVAYAPGPIPPDLDCSTCEP